MSRCTYAGITFFFACVILPATASADVITTTFTSNNGQAGNMFNINVLAAPGIEISQLDLNLDTGNWDIELYTKPGSYLGSESTPGDWTLQETITNLTSAGADNPTAWDISDLTFSSGPHAFYVNVTNGSGLNYTNGTTEGAIAAANADLEIFEGTGNTTNFGPQFRPRVWNGNIVYDVVTIPEPSMVTTLAAFSLLAIGRRQKRLN